RPRLSYRSQNLITVSSVSRLVESSNTSIRARLQPCRKTSLKTRALAPEVLWDGIQLPPRKGRAKTKVFSVCDESRLHCVLPNVMFTRVKAFQLEDAHL